MTIVYKCIRILFIILILKIILLPLASKDYLSNVITKHNLLTSITTKKIIILGNSASAFGINGNLLEKFTNRRTLILGIHGGLGLKEQFLNSHKYLNDSDIIIWNYSFENVSNYSFALTKPDKVSDFYNQNPLYHLQIRPNVINFLKSLLIYKIGKNDNTGIYNYRSFDKTGGIIYPSNQDTNYINTKAIAPHSKISIIKEKDIIEFIKQVPESILPNSYFVHTPIGKITRIDSTNILENIRICKKYEIKFLLPPLLNIYSSQNNYFDGYPHLSKQYRDTNTVKIIKYLRYISIYYFFICILKSATFPKKKKYFLT